MASCTDLRPLLLMYVFVGSFLVEQVSPLKEQTRMRIEDKIRSGAVTADEYDAKSEGYVTEPHRSMDGMKSKDSLSTPSVIYHHISTSKEVMGKDLELERHLLDKSQKADQKHDMNANKIDSVSKNKYVRGVLHYEEHSVGSSKQGILLGNWKFQFDNKFHCLPCICYYTSKGNIVAKCVEYSTIREIIAGVRNDTWSIRISKSKIISFQADYFVKYTQLQLLTVSLNTQLRKVCNSSEFYRLKTVTYLNLRRNAIASLENGSFRAFPNLHILDLSHNKISRITMFTLTDIGKLQILNLSSNHIEFLETGSLDYFLGLKILDLSRNRGLGYEKPLFVPLFQHLTSLNSFSIEGNCWKNDLSYPNKVIGQLSNLKNLSLDGIKDGSALGPEVKSLKHLVALHIGVDLKRRCYLENITENFYENTPNLLEIRILKCPIQFVDIHAYRNVARLQRLELMSLSSTYGIFDALDGLEGLQNSSLKSIRFTGLITKNYSYVFLTGHHSKYMANLKLEEIDLSNNRIAYMRNDFILSLPKTLTKLVLRESKLIEPYLLLDKLFFLKQLEIIDLGSNSMSVASECAECLQNGEYDVQEIDGAHGMLDTAEEHGSLYTDGQYDNLRIDQEQADLEMDEEAEGQKMVKDSRNEEISEEDGYLLTSSSLSENYDDASIYRNDVSDASLLLKGVTDEAAKDESLANSTDTLLQTMDMPSRYKIKIPPKLSILLAPRYTEMNVKVLLNNLQYAKNISLTKIDFSLCGLPPFHAKSAFPVHLRTLVLDGNYFRSLPCSLFPPNNSLTFLSLNNNLLGDFFAKEECVFRQLKNLFYLRISMNMIYNLPRNFFEGLDNLNMLLLRENKLQVLNTNFSNLPSLRYLDLRRNSISYINRNTRDDLDTIAARHPLYIDISQNPLRCTCEGLELLRWIWASNVKFVSSDFLRCIVDDGSVHDVGNLEDRVKTLERSCTGKAIIIVICVASLVVIITLVGFGLMYRYRWKLRYIRSVALSRFVGFKPRQITSSVFKFDAYILYSEMSRHFALRDCRQELEVSRGHNLCLVDRDFMPGVYEVSSIVSAIQNSRKTVLLVTPDFFEEEYSEYAMKMAIMEEVYTKRSVLHVCVYQPIPNGQMDKSPDLLMIMKKNNYTEFPSAEEASEQSKQVFWDQLSTAIGPVDNEQLRLSLDNREPS